MYGKTHRYFKVFLSLMLCLVLVSGCSGLPFGADKKTDQTSPGEGTVQNGFAHEGGSEGYDLIICLDNSESMWDQQEERNEAARAICKLAKTGDNRIGGLYFGQKIYGTNRSLTEKVDDIAADYFNSTEQDPDNMDTNIGLALENAAGLLKEDENTLTRKKAVILFSDGRNSKAEYDAATEKWAKELQKMGAEIYCVYLDRERASNQEYLKKITNYFDEDSHLEEERFIFVGKGGMNTLFDAFVKTFYNLQEDARYREVQLDKGEMSFTIPSLGISALQIAVHTTGEAALNRKNSDISIEPERDGNNIYFLYENPEPGDYTLKVEGDDHAAGFAAYYSELRANIGIVSDSGSADVAKGQGFRITAEFYNPDGKKAVLDKGAEICPSINGQEFKPMYEENGTWYSEKLGCDYGTFQPAVDVHFGDFINMTYLGEAIEVAPKAPVAYTVKREFESETNSDGMEVFTVPAGELFYNPEPDEAVKITHCYDLENQDETVDYTIDEGNIVFTVPQAGKIHIVMGLEDEKGLSSENEAEMIGTVVNIAEKNRRKTMGIIAAAAILVIVIILVLRHRGRKKRIESLKGDFTAHKKNLWKTMGYAEEEAENLEKAVLDNKESRSLLDGALKEVAEKSSTLTADQRQALGFTEYENRTFRDLFTGELIDLDAVLDELKNGLEEKNRSLEQLQGLQSASSEKELKKQVRQLSEEFKSFDGYKKGIAGQADQIRKEKAGIDKIFTAVNSVLDNYKDLFNRPIRFNLVIEGSLAMGTKACIQKGNYIRGSYPLDSINMFYYDNRYIDEDKKPLTLEKILNCSTGIAVIPFEETGAGGRKTEGLRLTSKQTFDFREEGDTEGFKTVDKADLREGSMYTIEVGSNKEPFTVTIEKKEV